jgi:hypothetical protein
MSTTTPPPPPIELKDFNHADDVGFAFSNWEQNNISSFDMAKYLENLKATNTTGSTMTEVVRFLMDVGRIGYGPNVNAWPGFNAKVTVKDTKGADHEIDVKIDAGKTMLKIASKGARNNLLSFTSHSLGLSALFHQVFITGDPVKTHWNGIPGITDQGYTQFMTTMGGFDAVKLDECYAKFEQWANSIPNVKNRADEVQKAIRAAALQTIANRTADNQAKSFQEMVMFLMSGDIPKTSKSYTV